MNKKRLFHIAAIIMIIINTIIIIGDVILVINTLNPLYINGHWIHKGDKILLLRDSIIYFPNGKTGIARVKDNK